MILIEILLVSTDYNHRGPFASCGPLLSFFNFRRAVNTMRDRAIGRRLESAFRRQFCLSHLHDVRNLQTLQVIRAFHLGIRISTTVLEHLQTCVVPARPNSQELCQTFPFYTVHVFNKMMKAHCHQTTENNVRSFSREKFFSSFNSKPLLHRLLKDFRLPSSRSQIINPSGVLRLPLILEVETCAF